MADLTSLPRCRDFIICFSATLRQAMGRLKSRRGCSTCKARRKKCHEQKPVCSACLRLGLKCSYERTGTSTSLNQPVVIGTYCLTSPLYQTRQLPMNYFTSVQVEAIVTYTPSLLENLFLSTYTYGTQCINEVMQITLGFNYVSDAAVACLTAILITQQDLSNPLPQQVWYQASRSIRSVSPTSENVSVMLFTSAVAAMFMSAIEVS